MEAPDYSGPSTPAGVDGWNPFVPGSADPSLTRSRRTFESLSVPNYRKFFAGQAVSLAGTWMQSVAMAWLVLQLTGSATWLGLVIALQTLPILLLGPYAGVLVDRVDKRRTIVATQTAAAVLALVLGLLTVRGDITLAWVLELSLVLGVVNTIDNPARQSFVREMVPAQFVRNAVTLNSVVVNASRAVGPAIGGVLIATLGVGACFLVNAASFLAVIGAYVAMDTAALMPSEPTSRAPGQLREGLAYIRRTPDLFVPLVMMAMVGTLTYEFQVTLPALTTDTFGEGATSLGWIMSAMGLGAVVGGLVSASRHSTGIRPLVASATAFGLATALTAIAPTVKVAAGALLLVGAASLWFLSVGNATLQLTATLPDARASDGALGRCVPGHHADRRTYGGMGRRAHESALGPGRRRGRSTRGCRPRCSCTPSASSPALTVASAEDILAPARSRILKPCCLRGLTWLPRTSPRGSRRLVRQLGSF